MSTMRDRTNPRLRRALELLAQEPDGSLRREEIWAGVTADLPLAEPELELTKSGTRRGETYFLWYTVDLVKAGWLFKSGGGNWRITDAGREALLRYPDPDEFARAANHAYGEWSKQRRGTGAENVSAETLAGQLIPGDHDALVRALLRRILDEGLGSAGSHFRPGRPVWSAATADDLLHRYNEQPDVGSGTFLQKLGAQLDGAPDETLLLATELMTLSTLPLSNLGANAKRVRLRSALALLDEPCTIPADVEAALGQGCWNGGVGMNVLAWKALAHLVEFVRYWWTLTAERRTQALADPWTWKEVVHSGPDVMASQREALLYLAFPATFLPIINVDHKRRIRNSFAQPEARSADLDRDLFAITTSLQVESHGEVRYYEEPLMHLWSPPGSADATRRAWLVRGSAVNGQNLVPRWLAGGWLSLWARHLEPLEPGSELSDVRAGIDIGYQGRGVAYRRQKAQDAYAFLSRMAPGDLVVTTSEGRLYVGEVAGDAEWSTDDDLPARLRRPVRWLNAVSPIAYESLPAPLPDRLASQDDVTDLTDDLDVIASLVVAEGHDIEPKIDVLDVVVREVVLTPPSADLAEELLVPLSWLERLVRLLGDRRQVILYGPPGTGKTYLALKVARSLVNDPGDVRLVQFHPSYSYEDFFEGYRPVKGADGQVGFELKAGPLRRIVEAARDNPTTPYVLVIDEINRANLAKVFGELYFLLEYRDQSVDLLYGEEGTEAFRLPANVFVMGTMNTADRSIALVDAAMRRRFAFVSLHPDESHVKGMLRGWLTREGWGEEPALILEALNARIDDSDFRVGPSYFMRESVYARDDGLDEMWETSILPLLAEHHVGDSIDIRGRYGLVALRRAIAAAAPSDVVVPEPVEEAATEAE